MAETDADFPTTIGADATFKGKLQFEKGARLLGKVDGEIKTKGQLVIAEGGSLIGEAKAGNIRVEGTVNGNLETSGKLQLSSSARIEGDIQASRLEVAEGAVLVGHCTVGPKGETQTSGAIKTASAPAEQVAQKRETVAAGGKR